MSIVQVVKFVFNSLSHLDSNLNSDLPGPNLTCYPNLRCLKKEFLFQGNVLERRRRLPEAPENIALKKINNERRENRESLSELAI